MQISYNKRIRLLSAVGGLLAFAISASPARATPTNFTDASFVTVAAGSALEFTFAGFSAADTDLMRLVFNGQVIFDNQTATVGQTVTTGPLAAGTYQLSLTNVTSGTTYSSNPALNPDGAHLGFSSNFADFNLGALPAGAGPAPYYGWEDRPLAAGGTLDYNDLVFSVAVKAVPEPGTLMLLGGSLLALGAVRHRRRR
jgi:hypothetical protein